VATRLYLRDTPSYEAPTAGKKSTALPNAASTSGNSGNPFENRSLLTVRGETVPDSTISITSLATTAHTDQYIGRFTSRKLAAQTIAANTWTAGLMALETNTGANSLHQLSVYVWRPTTSSVVGYIYDAHTDLGVEWLAGLDGQVLNFSGAAVTAEQGDVLVMELWRHTAAQGAATAWAQTHNYNSYVDVTGSTTADPASYLETPQNLTFDTAYLPAAMAGVFVETPGFAGPIKDGNGNLYVLCERTELTPDPTIYKSTDGGKTWAEQDSANRPGSGGFEDMESASMILSGTKLKFARMRSGTGNVHLSYHEFNTSESGTPDTWAKDTGKSCTATTADVFTCTAHGYTLGDSVKFSALTGGTGLSAGTLYFIIAGSLTANTFQVSTSQAGSAVNLTSALTAGTVQRCSDAIVGIATGDPTQEQVTLIERSNGDLVLIYGEFVSSTSSRIVYRKKVSGGEWGSVVPVYTGAIGSCAVLGASDKIHIFCKQDSSSAIGGAANSIQHLSLNSSDTLSSAETVNDNAVTSIENMVSRAVYYDDAGTETVYVAWAMSTGFLAGAFVINDGTPSAEETISDQIVWINPPDTAPLAPIAALAVDAATKTIYCAYSNNPSNTPTAQAPASEGDLYLATRTHGVGWGTDVELRDGVRIQDIFANVYTHSVGNGGAKVLGMFYDDANGPFYDEFTISSAAIAGTSATTLGALTASGAGALPIVGASSPTLGALTSAAAGALPIAAAASATLGALTSTAEGDLVTSTTAPTVAASGGTGTASNTDPFAVPYGDLVEDQVALQIVTTGNGARAQTPPSTGPNGEAIEQFCLNVADANAVLGDKVMLTVIAWVASATTSAGTLSWGISTADQWRTAWLTIDDANTADLLEAIQTWSSNTAGAEATVPNPIPSPTLSVTNENCLIITAIGSNVDDVDQIPAGYTLLVGGDSGGACQAVSVRDTPSTAAETVASANWGIAAGSRYYSGAVFAINGAVSAAGPIAGDASLALAAIALTAAGALAGAGAATVTLGAATSSATGTLAIAGAAAPTLGDATLTAAGASSIAGAGAVTLDAATAAAAGALPIVGQSATTLVAATLTAAGVSSIAAAASITLDAATLSAAGGAPALAGASAVTLAALALTGSGALGIAGASAAVLGALTASAAGLLLISGATASALDALTASATGLLPLVGAASPSLAALTLSSAGALPIAGASAQTLAALTSVGAGQLQVEDAGLLIATLEPLTMSAMGLLPIVGAVTPSLAALILAAAGQLPVTGSTTGTLGQVTVTAEGDLTGADSIVGSAAISLGEVASTAVGHLGIFGAGAPILAAVTGDSAATLRLAGTASITLSSIMLSAIGGITVPSDAEIPEERSVALTGMSRSIALDGEAMWH
jgi:hypothetical protein